MVYMVKYFTFEISLETQVQEEERDTNGGVIISLVSSSFITVEADLVCTTHFLGRFISAILRR